MTITLNDKESIAYLDMQTTITNLKENLMTMHKSATVNVGTQKVEVTSTTQVDHDIELARDLSKPTFVKVPNKPLKSSKGTNWESWELGKLYEAMDGNTAPSIKKLERLCGQLGSRSEASIRSKLHGLGATVVRGVVQGK